MEAKERLWWNADRSKILPDGHKNAAILYAAPGDEIPDSAAKKYRLVDGYLKGSAAAKEAAKAAEGVNKESDMGGGKEGAKGGNKEADKGGNKQGAKGGNKQGGLKITKTKKD